MSEGLAHDPYVVARMGFESATYLTQGTDPTTELPRSITYEYMDAMQIRHVCTLYILDMDA